MKRNSVHAGLMLATMSMLTMLCVASAGQSVFAGLSGRQLGLYLYRHGFRAKCVARSGGRSLPPGRQGKCHWKPDSYACRETGSRRHYRDGNREPRLHGKRNRSTYILNGTLLRTATLNVAYDSDGNHARMIFTSLTLADGTVLPVVVTNDASRASSSK